MGNAIYYKNVIGFNRCRMYNYVVEMLMDSTHLIASTSPYDYYYGNKLYQKNDVLYVCFDGGYYGYGRTFVYKSIDNGITWTNLSFPVCTSHQPRIFITSNNDIHIAYKHDDNYGISYRKYDTATETWEAAQKIIQYPEGEYPVVGYPDIVLDSNGYVHIIYGYMGQWSQPREVHYQNNSEGSWSEPAVVSDGGEATGGGTLLIDSADKLHCLYFGHNGAGICYTNNVLGSWAVSVQVLSGLSTRYAKIDSSDDIYVVGSKSISGTPGLIGYNKRLSGSWTGQETIYTDASYPQYTPVLTLDDLNDVHVVWAGKSVSNPTYFQVFYSTNELGSWSTPIIKTSGGVDKKIGGIIWELSLHCISYTTAMSQYAISANLAPVFIRGRNMRHKDIVFERVSV